MQKPAQATALVYDRDPITLTAVAAVLHAAGYDCLCARSLEAARKAMAQNGLDLLVWDLGSDADAELALLHELRGANAPTPVPLILITTAKDAERIASMDVADATYCLSKPYDPRTLTDLAQQATWMPHLVSQHRMRGNRPVPSGWVTL